MITFKELGIDEQTLKAIDELGFTEPMPIQEKVIPHLMKNTSGDLIALAQTGTGKTAAFGLPLIQMTDGKNKSVQHLILCPTRELCLQIKEDLSSYAKFKDDIKITAVYGGTSIDNQIKNIKRGSQIISATPGRLLDLIKRGSIDISKISTVVLDEADEMLNMGFREELEAILSKTPAEKNTLLFSATMPNDVLRIANRYMKNPAEISVGKRNAGAANVEHVYYMVHAKDRYLALKRITDYYPEIYGIIFCRTRQETRDVAEKLVADGYNAEALHGDLSQQQRDTVMNKFRIKHLKLLVATDVAARGLDVDSLTHIINYNLPEDLEVYTHRSGRTGRAGKTGTSIVIANLKEKHKLRQIEKQLNKKFVHMPVPTGEQICEKQLFNLIDRMQNVEVNHEQIDDYLPVITKKLQSLDRDELIKKFVSLEFNRFADYYRNTPNLNIPTDGKLTGKKRNSVSGYSRFFINLGRADKLTPSALIGLVNDFTRIENIEIGDIELLNTYSFFEADSDYTDVILKSFKNRSYKKRKISIEIAESKRGGKKRLRKRAEETSADSKPKKSKKKKSKLKKRKN